MTQLIFQGAFLISVIVAVVYMLKIRRAGTQDPAMVDGLTIGERILAIITVFFGGVIIVGSIFYYGWKKRFPQKARSVLHIEWVFLAVVLLAALVFGYWQYTQTANVSTTLQKLDEQADQVQKAQDSSLESGTSQRYQGAGYAINIPSAWVENKPLDGSGSDYFVKNWIVPDATQRVSVSWTNSSNPNSTLWYSEAVILDDAASSPDKFTLTHPLISGASGQTNMVVGQSGDYVQIDLFVHGVGRNLYKITGSLTRATPAQTNALTQIILSFEMSK